MPARSHRNANRKKYTVEEEMVKILLSVTRHYNRLSDRRYCTVLYSSIYIAPLLHIYIAPWANRGAFGSISSKKRVKF